MQQKRKIRKKQAILGQSSFLNTASIGRASLQVHLIKNAEHNANGQLYLCLLDSLFKCVVLPFDGALCSYENIQNPNSQLITRL